MQELPIWHLRSSLSAVLHDFPLITTWTPYSYQTHLVHCSSSVLSFFPLFIVPEATNPCLSKSTLPSHLVEIFCSDSSTVWLGTQAHKHWSQAFSQFRFSGHKEVYWRLLIRSISWRKKKNTVQGDTELQHSCYRAFGQSFWKLWSWDDFFGVFQLRQLYTTYPPSPPN